MIFIFATAAEAEPFRTACPTATIKICGVGSAECGASTAEIIAEMRMMGEDKTLVLAGIAGSYSLDQVAMCEVVEVIQTQIEALPSRFAVSYNTQPKTSLRSVSLNTVSGINQYRDKAQIEDMEGAAFVAVCQRLNARSIHIRSISNVVGDSFDKWQIASALEALTKVLEEMFVNL